MATKWKSSLVILATCACLFTVFLTGLILVSSHGNYYAQKDYFHTPEFQDELSEFARCLGTHELHSLSIQEAKLAIPVSEDEIMEHRYRDGDLEEQISSIEAQYEDVIQQAEDRENQLAADAYMAERKRKIEDITLSFESDEHVRQKVLKEKEQLLEQYYSQIDKYDKKYESYQDSFVYYFTDETSGQAFTNREETGEIAQDDMLFITDYTISNEDMVQFGITGYEEMLEVLHETGERQLEGQIGVPKSLAPSNPFMIRYENYQRDQVIFWSVAAISLIALLLSLIIFKKAKRSRAEISKWRSVYEKIPIDIRVVLLGLTGFISFIGLAEIANITYLLFERLISDFISLIILILILTACLMAFVAQGMFLTSTMKDWQMLGEEWKKSLLYQSFKILKRYSLRFIHSLKAAFLDQTTGTQVILILGLVFFLGIAAVLIIIHPIFIVIYIVLLGAVGIPLAMLTLNKVGYFNKIVENTNQLAAGNLSEELEVTGKSAFATLAANINLLKKGVKKSQSEQAKSERLKTELITNVSHDLRTPLTSIITYTELLKEQADIGDDSAAYVEVIDRKSKRLKVLIDDLFEVSKMVSGNLKLTKTKVDLVQLLQQALAEYDDMINDSSLQFRVSNEESPIYAVVDGQKLWRVFDNLIGNILKYSLEHSRVYINLTATNGEAKITFKNVSKYELNENSDELFERFKRGDVSRNTEGSGLGLAIAQSIVELHDGSLDIDTDGDLFKVTITLKNSM